MQKRRNDWIVLAFIDSRRVRVIESVIDVQAHVRIGAGCCLRVFRQNPMRYIFVCVSLIFLYRRRVSTFDSETILSYDSFGSNKNCLVTVVVLFLFVCWFSFTVIDDTRDCETLANCQIAIRLNETKIKIFTICRLGTKHKF